jgi:hypothetical protein
MRAAPRTGDSRALLVLAGAFAAGVLLAKCLDWLGNGCPR